MSESTAVVPAKVGRLRTWIAKALNLQTLRASSSGGWWPWGGIKEADTGNWQRNITLDNSNTLMAFSAVFCCVTGIARDVAKMRIKLDRDIDGIWTEITTGSPWLPVLRKPNHYQTRLKFIEWWVVSLLLWGNAIVLKKRDQRGVVTALYVLDPSRVTTLVAEDGGVYYEVRQDFLSEVPETVTIPASEIIHDMMVSLWHPLIGVSPLYACAMSSTMGNRIQGNSTLFFGNASRPSGILTAPGEISDTTAARLKANFETNFGGANVGRVAVLGDGLKFEVMTMPAEASQLIEQLRWTVSDVCRAFHYPEFKAGGALPPYAGNAEVLTISYYTDCLQGIVEGIESSLDEGLELPNDMGTELDLDNLVRMDTAALYDSNNKAVSGGWMTPNEARFRANLPKVKGGDSPMIQQQNYSLEALAKRDAKKDPFETTPPPQPKPDPNAPADPNAPKPAPPDVPPPPPPPAKGLDEETIEEVCDDLMREELELV